MTQQLVQREVAHRVFAVEMNDTTHELKGEGEMAPSYVVTPLGAKVNRVFIVGVLTERENIGQDGNDLWRARVSDPTGVFTLYAGQFQPEAAQALAELDVPSFVAVVGKARTYEPEPGSLFVSIRPESITPVDETTRDEWILATADHTHTRIDAVARILRGEVSDAEGLARKGVPARVAEGVAIATDHYGAIDLKRYHDAVLGTLDLLRSGESMPVHEATAQGTPTGSFQKEATGTDPEQEALEKMLLATIETLLDQDESGAPWDEVVDAATQQGRSEEEVEEALNGLMDKGLIYEPVLGKLKMT